MHSHKSENEVQQIGEIFHKERSKENKRSKGSKGSKALSLKVRVARLSSPKRTDESKEERPKARQQSLNSRASAAKNAKIDEYLLDLLMRDLIDEDFWKFHTKAMHQLGMNKYNSLYLESLDGRNPKHLLAYKLKGAIDFDAKKQMYRDKYELQ